jgi:hypothetical protein
MLVITTALVVLHAFVTTRTVIGRQIYAVGTKAAKRSGIKTERLRRGAGVSRWSYSDVEWTNVSRDMGAPLDLRPRT